MKGSGVVRCCWQEACDGLMVYAAKARKMADNNGRHETNTDAHDLVSVKIGSIEHVNVTEELGLLERLRQLARDPCRSRDAQQLLNLLC